MLLEITEGGGRVDFDLAAVLLGRTGNDPHQRRLARAVGPDQRHALARDEYQT